MIRQSSNLQSASYSGLASGTRKNGDVLHPPTLNALSGALDRIGDRWSLLLVEALDGGPLRFADLQDAVVGISTNILSARLRRLEAEGVVLAVPYSDRPRRFSYELTRSGHDLGGVVRVLTQWGADQTGAPPTPGARSTHAACGSAMQAVWWCPTCDEVAPPDGAGDAGTETAVWV
jgi:DNA-binding HxlR family transcriptional regulator